MKKIIFSMSLLVSAVITSCSGGMTLKDLAEMSEIERQQLTEVKLKVELPEGSELDFWKTFQGFTNLKTVEIDKNFKGTITGYGSMHNGPEHLVSIIAEGATKIGYSCFYAGADRSYNEDIVIVKFPSVIEMDLHAFGGYRATNQIRELDFPKLQKLGSELAGCKKLTTLKLGHEGPISFYSSFEGSLNTQNIDLYIGKYEYENHVEGNVLYPHAYRNLDKGDYSLGNSDTENPKQTCQPLTFKSIQLYK